jgi:hypothetical protein
MGANHLDSYELNTAISRMEAQLQRMYRERQARQSASARPALGFPGCARQAASEDWVQAAQRLEQEVQEQRRSMEAQLETLEAERKNRARLLGSGDTGVIIEMIQSLEEQLKDLYAEKEACANTTEAPTTTGSALRARWQELNRRAQETACHSWNALGQHWSGQEQARAMLQALERSIQNVSELERKLVACYAEQEELAQRFGVTGAAELARMAQNLEAQLVDMYAQRARENRAETPLVATQPRFASAPPTATGQTDFYEVLRNLESQIRQLKQIMHN